MNGAWIQALKATARVALLVLGAAEIGLGQVQHGLSSLMVGVILTVFSRLVPRSKAHGL